MNISKYLAVAAAFVFLCMTAVAQRPEKFDIVTFTAPAGWEAKRTKDAVLFTKMDKDAGTFCVLTITRSTPSDKDSKTNFRNAWEALVTDAFEVNVQPQMGNPGVKDGWDAEVGLSAFEAKELKGAAVLTTFTAGTKSVSVLAITNSESYETAIAAFVDSVKLPPVAAAPVAAAPAPTANVDPRLYGRWQRSGSSSPSYADPASWGTSGYTKSRYEFFPNGTYAYTERSFRYSYQNIIVVKENGRFAVNGNTIAITPAKSTITAYRKAGGVDALGAVVSTQNRRLEPATYRFTLHYFEGIKEWNLVLQADAPTQRDGQFSGNTTFQNAWYFDQRFTDTDLTAVRAQ